MYHKGQHQPMLVASHPVGTPATARDLLHRSYPGDAGFDLFCRQSAVLAPGERVDIPLGVRCQIPVGWWGLLTGRSSTLRKRGLLVAQGVIDQGYRGPLFALIQNLTAHPVEVRDGERLAQLILIPLYTGDPVLVEDLNDSVRGVAGFGSTGR